MDGRTKAIVAHITIVGWIIALIINNNDKDEFASFYIRQTLGLYLAGFILSFIPFIGWVLSVVVFVFWILSLLGAIQNEIKETPVAGNLFQEWFRAL
jgi:uncharacterized membrane protein